MKKRLCLVTGGAGFIGSHVVDLLIDDGHRVIVIDNLSTGREANINKKSEFVRCDIRYEKKLRKHFKKVDWVFHLAAWPRIQPSFDDPLEHEMVNVVGTINCLKIGLEADVKRFVYSASSACYGTPDRYPTSETEPIRPLSPYALQKYAAEQYVLLLGKRFGLPAVALRYFNVYGPRSYNEKNIFNAYSSVIGIFEAQKKRGKPLTVTGDGLQSRDFIHVRDVARANLRAATSTVAGDFFNIGCGKTYTVLEVAKMFNQPIVFIPERKGEARITCADIRKAKTLLKWKPSLSLSMGLKELES